jgi:hypothetical protein
MYYDARKGGLDFRGIRVKGKQRYCTPKCFRESQKKDGIVDTR